MSSRRRFLTSVSTLGAAVAAGGPGAAQAVFGAPQAATGRQLLALQPFPAGAQPFDNAGRRSLAMDVLTFFVKQQGLFPGKGVFLLPAAPWFGGWEPVASKRSWDFKVPAGQPLYLLAAADPNGKLDAATTTITVNGAALPDLASYVHGGVPALHGGETKEHAVLDLVFAPPAPGNYRLEVKSRIPHVVTTSSEDGERTETTYTETQLLYDITVQASDALGSLLLRDPSGRVFATQGRERRQVPDPETLQALGYPAWAQVNVSAELLDYLPEGAPLPQLRNGLLVRADNHNAVFRLDGGKRVWQRDLPTTVTVEDPAAQDLPSIQTVEAAVLGAIVPVLHNDMLLKGAGSDVYHVDKGALRKVPDWKWVQDRRLSPSDTFFVPDRIIATLPQNSPHWVMPGGTFEDRAFHSETLGRQMPFRVYLPPEYYDGSRAGQRYPVIYLLHGMGGRYDEWSGYGVEEVANELIMAGKLPHVIIVAPQGGLGYWMNQDNGTPWADYVTRDFVRHVDSSFRTVAQRTARAIGGLSMGAHGALQLSLNYPDLFGTVGAHSPSIRSQESAPAYFGRGGGFARRDPISLIQDSTLQTPPRIWVDAGREDNWLPGAEALHRALQEKGWPHEWKLFAGGHDGWYWGDHIWDYLPFYADSFAKYGVPLTR